MSVTVNRFNYKKEQGQNPYCGIVSFQHFSGEKLYSDITVLPENNMCETERVECYPISSDAEENGRQQGYYPDNSVAYFRVLWKDFEVEQNKFDYGFIENILSCAKQKGQTVMLRLMPHATRQNEDVPDWLKKLIDCPDRPNGERVKDSPKDPLFIKSFCTAIKELGKKFDKNPYLYAIDISVPGAWGEGHKIEEYPIKDINSIYTTYVKYFKNTQLFTQLGMLKKVSSILGKSNIGWRGDGLGNPWHMENKYPMLIKQVEDNWKTAPVSFESYWWLYEWQRKGWDIDQIIEKTLEWHITSFNPKSMPIPPAWQQKIEYWISKMGYHYKIDSAEFNSNILDGKLNLNLKLSNVGVAPCYRQIPFFVKLEGKEEHIFNTDINIKNWMPGNIKESINLSLPKAMAKGEYQIKIGVLNEQAKVYFATDAEYSDGWYLIGTTTVG